MHAAAAESRIRCLSIGRGRRETRPATQPAGRASAVTLSRFARSSYPTEAGLNAISGSAISIEDREAAQVFTVERGEDYLSY
jgi:hypothetical protein